MSGNRGEMLERYKELIDAGNGLRKDFLSPHKYGLYHAPVSNGAYRQWKREVLDLLRHTLGDRSSHYMALAAMDERAGRRAPVFTAYLDTLKSAYADYGKAAPVSRSNRVSPAGVFDDYLKKAQELLEGRHYLSAATLAGAVLEDVLRRVCDIHEAFCPENASLEVVNDKLLKAGVYGADEHKAVFLKLQLRKMAELCYVEKINSANVGEMIGWVREFSGRYLSGPRGRAGK